MICYSKDSEVDKRTGTSVFLGVLVCSSVVATLERVKICLE